MGAESTPARGVGGRTRAGVCHRCGWRGPVTKVTRADRRQMQIGRAFGRICAECRVSLLGGDEAAAANVQPRKPKLIHRRDVA